MRASSLMIAGVFVAACGGAQQPAGGGTGSGSATPVSTAQDTRTPIEVRRDTACDELGPRVTACAVEDAKADLAAGKTTQQQFAQDTSREVQHKNTEKFVEACKVPMSSRQVRVLEVCSKEETACAPLLDCLSHLNDTTK